MECASDQSGAGTNENAMTCTPLKFHLEVSCKDKDNLKSLLDYLFAKGSVDFEWMSFDNAGTEYSIALDITWSHSLMEIAKILEFADF